MLQNDRTHSVRAQAGPEKRKLRLGIVLDSYQVPAWAYCSLERMVASDYAEFSLIILRTRSGHIGRESRLRSTSNRSTLDAFWKNRGQIAYRVFERIDGLFLKKQPCLTGQHRI